MRILAIETSMGAASVALMTGDAANPLIEKLLPPGPGQAEGIIPLIGTVMSEANVAFSALDRVAVCVGPGTFSGIRTGVAAARGIGLSARVPVVGATSFAIMAAAFAATGPLPEHYGIVAPAGMNILFCQVRTAGEIAPGEILALAPAEAADYFRNRAQILTGPAAEGLVETTGLAISVREPNLRPRAATLARLAPDLDPARNIPSPYYVRPADARPQTTRLVPQKAEP